MEVRAPNAVHIACNVTTQIPHVPYVSSMEPINHIFTIILASKIAPLAIINSTTLLMDQQFVILVIVHVLAVRAIRIIAHLAKPASIFLISPV